MDQKWSSPIDVAIIDLYGSEKLQKILLSCNMFSFFGTIIYCAFILLFSINVSVADFHAN